MKKISSKELNRIIGGVDPLTAVAVGIAASIAYDHVKHFVAGLFNPFTSNES